jgi:AraC-like DNA-binding protein
MLDPPWSLRIQDEAPLALIAIVRGQAWVVPDTAEPVRLRPGDIAITRGPDPYTLADPSATPPQAVIHPGERCTTPDGAELTDITRFGVRTWGNSPHGATIMLVGAYQLQAEVGRRLLGALPAVLVLPGDTWDSPLIPLVADEITKDAPAQEAVLDRLLDLLLIAVLRTWFARPHADPPAWYRAHSDPVVGHALRLLQNNPSHPWTVSALAAETRVSRAVLARRFTKVVGEPPMKFLTAWRLALAADLLCEPDATIGSVATQVGYGSPFALSTAFKRERGISPQEHRARAARR